LELLDLTISYSPKLFCRPTITAHPIFIAGLSPEPFGVFPSASRLYVEDAVSERNKNISKNDINFSKGDMFNQQGRYA